MAKIVTTFVKPKSGQQSNAATTTSVPLMKDLKALNNWEN